MTTANDVLAARTRIRWTQKQLADVLGVTWRTVQRWEAGTTTPPPFLKDRLAELEREHRTRREA